MHFAKKELKDNIKFIFQNGTEKDLLVSWSIDGLGSYDFNNRLEDRAFTHGSDMVGDGLSRGRIIKLNLLVLSERVEEHENMLNTIYTLFYNTDYDLYLNRIDRLFKIAGINKITHEYIKGFKEKGSNVNIHLLLKEPFRYSREDSRLIFNIPRDVQNHEIRAVNLGSVNTPTTFIFTPKSKMANIKIEHKESKKTFTINDALLISPKKLKVNSDYGTVWRDESNSINSFSGQFLELMPGENTFLYTGSAGTIELIYRTRWFV